MKFFILIIMIATLFFYNQSYSQIVHGKGVQVELKGKVTDEFTGTPIGVTMEIKSQDGKKIKINSNSKDGTYSQLLNAGENYEIILTNYDVVRQIENLSVNQASAYTEQTKNFTVKKMQPGTELFKLNAFNQSMSDINAKTDEMLNEIQEIMKFNRSVKLEFVVNAHDTYYKAAKDDNYDANAKPSKSKKKNKKEASLSNKKTKESESETNTSKINSLVQNRIESLKKIVNTWTRYQQRIQITADYSLGTATSALKGEDLPDLIIKVTSVENPLD